MQAWCCRLHHGRQRKHVPQTRARIAAAARRCHSHLGALLGGLPGRGLLICLLIVKQLQRWRAAVQSVGHGGRMKSGKWRRERRGASAQAAAAGSRHLRAVEAVPGARREPGRPQAGSGKNGPRAARLACPPLLAATRRVKQRCGTVRGPAKALGAQHRPEQR